MGIYHAYTKGFNRDSRAHKLFLVASGGCGQLCDTYFNLTVDVRYNMTVRSVLDSDETWYLRRVNQRNNARILYRVASELGLIVPVITDACSANEEDSETVSPTTETVLYDIVKQKNNRVSYFSNCVDTLCCRNGILCGMHHSEGVWLFKGPVATNTTMMHYGGPFGNSDLQTSFPVSMCPFRSNYTWNSRSVPGSQVALGKPCFVTSTDCSAIARLDRNANLIEAPVTDKYTYIDEAYTKMLEDDCKWNRDNGIVQLMPLAVVAVQG